MRKNYILDANILLHDPQSIFHFADNVDIIPVGVITEIDRFKKEQTDRGFNARAVVRHLDRLTGPLGPWLHTVATRTAVALRRRTNRPVVLVDTSSDSSAGDTVSRQARSETRTDSLLTRTRPLSPSDEVWVALRSMLSQRAPQLPVVEEWRLIGLLRHADVVVGNSSSGVIEAPAAAHPVVVDEPRVNGMTRIFPLAFDPERGCLRSVISPLFQS